MLNSACITKHAIRRFRERTRSKKSDEGVQRTIRSMMNKAEPFEPDPEYKVKSLMKHGFREAFYFEVDGWVLVIVNEALTTMFQPVKNTRQMWRSY